jgi:hypothetical protein
MPSFTCNKNVCSCAIPQKVDSPHGCIIDDKYNKPALNNGDEGINPSRPKRLDCFVAEKTTVLHIKVQNTQAKNTTMSAIQLAQQVLDVYSCVSQSATIHGISIIEPRTDSFVCVLDADDPNCEGDPVGQLLAFAADLNSRLTSRPEPLQSRMGMASGPTALIGSHPAVVGDTANIAEDMARLGTVATVVLHESALFRWAPSAPPVDCAGGRAVFDFETGSFRPAAAAAAATPKIAAAMLSQPPPPCAARQLCPLATFA